MPQLSSLDDTSNFEEFEKIKHPVSFEETKGHQFSGKDLPFLGFTFVKKDNARLVNSDIEVMKLSSCSNQLIMKFYFAHKCYNTDSF